jgi:hypothetical protein
MMMSLTCASKTCARPLADLFCVHNHFYVYLAREQRKHGRFVTNEAKNIAFWRSRFTEPSPRIPQIVSLTTAPYKTSNEL